MDPQPHQVEGLSGGVCRASAAVQRAWDESLQSRATDARPVTTRNRTVELRRGPQAQSVTSLSEAWSNRSRSLPPGVIVRRTRWSLAAYRSVERAICSRPAALALWI